MSPYGSDYIFTVIIQRAWRRVSEDPSRTSPRVRDRCLPLAFIPKVMRAIRSNPSTVKCSRRRIARTTSSKGVEDLFLHEKRMYLEERDNDLFKLTEGPTRMGEDVAPWTFRSHVTASKMRTHRFEHVAVIAMLVHLESGLQLPTSVPVHH